MKRNLIYDCYARDDDDPNNKTHIKYKYNLQFESSECIPADYLISALDQLEYDWRGFLEGWNN